MPFNDWHANHPRKFFINLRHSKHYQNWLLTWTLSGKNIARGFSKPAIWSFNKLAFSEESFIPSDFYAGADETTERTNETIECYISNLNNWKYVTPSMTDNIRLPSISKDIIPDPLRPLLKLLLKLRKERRK